MKKYIISSLGVLIVIITFLFIILNPNEKKEEKLKKVRLSEVAHSVFYAPQYAAISEGFFEQEGIEIELTLANGADKVMASLLSKDADIGLSGSEATIYVYNGKEKDYPKTFARLTQKDGSFLVSREKIENFTINDLKGKYIIGGRQGGMPEMTLEWILKEHGIDPKKDVTIDTSVAFSSMSSAFISGTGDFVSLFEPNALQLEQQNIGYVVESIGELGGEVPYTSYSARDSYIKNNKDIIISFTRAIQKGLDFVKGNDSETIAKSIYRFFPDTSIEDLTKIMDRYKKMDAWPLTTDFTQDAFDHMQDIMINAGELDEKVNFEELIYKVIDE